MMDGRYVITVSRAKDPNSPPRAAKFRSTYAAYCDLGQLYLPGDDFSDDDAKQLRFRTAVIPYTFWSLMDRRKTTGEKSASYTRT